jgi:hypothetical protein
MAARSAASAEPDFGLLGFGPLGAGATAPAAGGFLPRPLLGGLRRQHHQQPH